MPFKGNALGYCQYCGKVGQTQRHHIIFRSRLGDDEDENRIDLCVYCHGRVHKGEITMEQLKEAKEKDKERADRLSELLSHSTRRPKYCPYRGIVGVSKVKVLPEIKNALEAEDLGGSN